MPVGVERAERKTIKWIASTYIENYLSAHVDGELSAAELREAEAASRGMRQLSRALRRGTRGQGAAARARRRCAGRRRWSADRSSRRSTQSIRPTPPAPRAAGDRAAGADRAALASIRRARIWATGRDRRGRGLRVRDTCMAARPGTCACDPALRHGYRPLRAFRRALRTQREVHLARRHLGRLHGSPAAGIPVEFSAAGYKLVGGRIDRLPDGTRSLIRSIAATPAASCAPT